MLQVKARPSPSSPFSPGTPALLLAPWTNESVSEPPQPLGKAP